VNWLKNLAWWLLLLPCRLPAGFDSQWYRRRYPDVAQSGTWPSVHYRRFGQEEQRDPGPTSSGSSGWLHSECGVEGGVPMLQGAKALISGARTLVFVGHQAGPQLFGAERSLRDLVQATQALVLNVFVLLPEGRNPGYVKDLASLCCGVKIIPYGWWQADRAPHPKTIEQVVAFYEHVGASAVYVNTLTLDEPLVAATEVALPVAVHIRETLLFDPELSGRLRANQNLVECRLSRLATLVVANSRFTAEISGFQKALVVPNGLDVEPYKTLVPGFQQNSGVFTVGMVSSNTPKKGLLDFVDLARLLSDSDAIRCLLVGPETEDVKVLKARQAKGEIPDNLVFGGYVESPLTALANMDVLVSLSHVKETFGRTVLEAMAAGRVVVAYRQGAIPEMVRHDETGILVQPEDVGSVASAVRSLRADRARYHDLARSARETACEYDTEHFNARIKQALEALTSGSIAFQEKDAT